MNEVRPYSYHTFLLPFEIEKENGEMLGSAEIVEEEVLNTECWKEVSGGELSIFDAVILREDEIRENKLETVRAIKYNQEQYFHENVKKAIHNHCRSNIVREFVFKFVDENQKRFITLKYLDEEAEKAYILCVSNIRLKVFNTGICILIIELHNNDYREFKSVKEINSLGRQISLPYIAKESADIACAQEVNWDFLYLDNKTYSFKEKNENFWKDLNNKEKRYLLDFLENMIIDKKAKSSYRIRPSLDDRMFTCCLIQDNSLSYRYGIDYNDNTEAGIERYNRVSKGLYEYIYIDKEGGCSAATDSFRKEILNNSIYHRWTESGSIYGVSHTSLVAITGEGEFLETLITRPFLTQYVEIAILTLVQRASILRFQKQIQGDMNNKKIQKLQSEYIDYRNQLHFFEVSSQEQGIELYELIRKQLYIEKEMGALEKNLEILYEKNNVDNGNRFNQFGVLIGIIAILSIVLDLTNFVFERGGTESFWVNLKSLKYELVGILLFTFFISYSVSMFIKRKK